MVTTASDIGITLGQRAAWGRVLLALGLVLVALVLLYLDTARAMVAMWMSNDTYAHGFLILPISLWLVWEKRAELADALPQPTLGPVLLMVPVGFGWLLAHLVDVDLVQQYAFVTLLILGIWALVGNALSRHLAFPIAFLLFAVPVGEGLVYPMMNFTADFTVGMLRLTGIPVYRDGTFFSIPSGDWSVVTACSGIRYLLASVTLGVLYAYLTYSKFYKRLLFIFFAILVPILANGLRAYLIVMIAHLSDMRLATGVDHLIYGWVFFGIVITIMFAIGAIWRDPPATIRVASAGRGTGRSLQVVVGFLLAVAFIWPGLAWVMERPRSVDVDAIELEPIQAAGHWSEVEDSHWSWRPHLEGADGSAMRFYISPQGPVSLFVGLYLSQRQGAELVNHMNRMVMERDPGWSEREVVKRRVDLPAGAMMVNQSRISSRSGQSLLVWNWYRVGRVTTNNPIVAKLAEAGYRLMTGRRAGALIAVAAPLGDREDETVALLKEFIATMSPGIDGAIDGSVSRAGP